MTPGIKIKSKKMRKSILLSPCWDSFLFNALKTTTTKTQNPSTILHSDTSTHQRNHTENVCACGLHHPLLIDPLNGSALCK